MKTEITPEKCPFCGSAKRNALPAPNGAIRYGCGYWSDAYDEQSDLCRALEAKQKAEAEVEVYKDLATKAYKSVRITQSPEIYPRGDWFREMHELLLKTTN